MNIIRNVPCTLVIGFLGSGKTTTINHLLNYKAIESANTSPTTHSTKHNWGLLINEFGQIGIDGHLIDKQQTDENSQLSVKEVSGGCICCTSQLPLQIAISRLLTEASPSRLIIEPTGLAHPKTLIELLSAPHWQTSLAMQSVIGVLNARQWQDKRYSEHEGYIAHIQYADIVLINRYQQLSNSQKDELQTWIKQINPHTHLLWADEALQQPVTTNDSFWQQLNQPSQVMQNEQHAQSQQLRVNLTPLVTQTTTNRLPSISNAQVVNNNDDNANNQNDKTNTALMELPYRYHETQQGIQVGGWRLPASWIFDHDALQAWLLSLPNWQRIKGVLNTNYGWTRFNFTPDSLTTINCPDQTDNRLEVILMPTDTVKSSQLQTEAVEDKIEDKIIEDNINDKWKAWDKQLLALTLFMG